MSIIEKIIAFIQNLWLHEAELIKELIRATFDVVLAAFEVQHIKAITGLML